MKKFFAEFKKFITRGNIVDMAVGVTVGSAFTAIVNGLTNHVLKPLINNVLRVVLRGSSLNEVYYFLHKVEVNGVVDLNQSIYIDWGAIINVVINFLIIAFVLFTIVKVINHIKESQEKLEQALTKGKPTKEQKKELKAAGIKLSNKKAVKEYLENKAKEAEEEKLAEEAAAAEQARLDRLANPTTEDLLKEILATMKKQA